MDAPTDTAEAIEAAQLALRELQTDLEIRVAEARELLARAADELRRARAEARKSGIEYFTEAEFAAKLKVSEITLKRARLAGEMPSLRIRGCVRYTSEHLSLAAEKFARPRPRKHDVAARDSEGPD